MKSTATIWGPGYRVLGEVRVDIKRRADHAAGNSTSAEMWRVARGHDALRAAGVKPSEVDHIVFISDHHRRFEVSAEQLTAAYWEALVAKDAAEYAAFAREIEDLFAPVIPNLPVLGRLVA